MATIDSDYIQQMSSQLAQYEIQAAMVRTERNQKNYTIQLDAIRSLDSALQAFRSEIKGLSSTSGSMLVNSATFGQDGYATATVGSTAVAGSYDFFVEQLASRHQLSVEGLQDADVDMSGKLVIGQGAAGSFSIDLSTVDGDGNGINSLAEVADAINKAADNTGVNATLVRSDGAVSLVLASSETGSAHAITLSTVSTPGVAFDAAIAGARELSQALDAKVYLGGEGGMLLTSASNTFKQVIDGVDLTFTKKHVTGEQALNVTIGQDKTATKEKAESFITAMNTLLGKFDALTASGVDGEKRGALAGDSSIRFIENMLNSTARGDYGGVNLIEFGIAADRNGKLAIDVARFEKAVEANPDGFDKLFTGTGAMLETIDKNIAVYTNSTSGVMKTRKDTLNTMLKRVDEQFDSIQKQYDSHYSRYLKQYTNMMQIMASMSETSGMFG